MTKIANDRYCVFFIYIVKLHVHIMFETPISVFFLLYKTFCQTFNSFLTTYFSQCHRQFTCKYKQSYSHTVNNSMNKHYFIFPSFEQLLNIINKQI